MDRQGYFERLQRLERELIPRPLEFVLARKRENAVNPSVSNYAVQASATSGGGSDATDSSGADDLGFPLHKEPICPYDLVAFNSQWSKISRSGGGLYNLGNTCFLNSVLQCLTYTVPLAELAKKQYHTRRSRQTNDIYCLMELHINKALATNKNGAFAPKPIVRQLQRISRSFRHGRQEDAHEFLRAFIDALQKACLRAAGLNQNDSSRHAETTSIHRIFGGYLQSQVKCKICKFTSTTYDTCLDISLEIYGKSNSIEKALKQHTKLEVLDQDNRWRCDACRKLVPATKQLKYRRLPLVLVVHLKRFSPYGDKISKRVEYPKELNMKPFTSNKDREEDYMYDLYGVLVHAGNYASSGHYFCFVKASNEAWYEMNDSSVSQIGVQRALSQQAYILFYQKRVVRVEKKIQPKVLRSSSKDESQSAKNAENSGVGQKIESNMRSAWEDAVADVSKRIAFGPSLPPTSLKMPNRDSTNVERVSSSKYSASINAIMKGRAGTSILRRFIVNARALQAAKAYSSSTEVINNNFMDGYHEEKVETKEDYAVQVSAIDRSRNKKNDTDGGTVKFRQGNEVIKFHNYKDGKIDASSSIKEWKNVLKSRKGARNYNISKNRLNDETWDFGDTSGKNRSSAMMKLQSSLKKFEVRSDQDWARKRRPDEWDSNYDRGKTKKVKNNDFAARKPEGIGAKLQKAYESKHLKSKRK